MCVAGCLFVCVALYVFIYCVRVALLIYIMLCYTSPYYNICFVCVLLCMCLSVMLYIIYAIGWSFVCVLLCVCLSIVCMYCVVVFYIYSVWQFVVSFGSIVGCRCFVWYGSSLWSQLFKTSNYSIVYGVYTVVCMYCLVWCIYYSLYIL